MLDDINGEYVNHSLTTMIDQSKSIFELACAIMNYVKHKNNFSIVNLFFFEITNY